MDIMALVVSKFGEPQKCYGHCDKPATLKVLKSDGYLIACQACPAGYVSRVTAYGSGRTLPYLKAYLVDVLGEGADLKDVDLRTATRHPWDLGVPGAELTASYWTQNYRRTKSDDPNRIGLFVCARCGSPFSQAISSAGTMCSKCSG